MGQDFLILTSYNTGRALENEAGFLEVLIFFCGDSFSVTVILLGKFVGITIGLTGFSTGSSTIYNMGSGLP